jgi:hypothetical protein
VGNLTSTPSRRRWWIAGVAAGGLVLASAIGANASGVQPPPGTVSDAPITPQPDITQPPPGTRAASTELSPQPNLSQPPNPHPDLSGAPTQVVDTGPEDLGSPSPPGEVDTGVAGQPD